MPSIPSIPKDLSSIPGLNTISGLADKASEQISKVTGFPPYSYANELATMSDLGIRRGGGWDEIGGAMAGVNYYFDAIGFGESTGISKNWGHKQQPLGVQFFTKTGRKCPNGEPMYEYISTIPKGDILGERIQKEIRGIGLPEMRGLAPGVLEDARDALNPKPFFRAMSDPGKVQCKLLRARVGDAQGRLVSPKNPDDVWVEGPTQRDAQGMPTQEFWVQNKDASPEFVMPSWGLETEESSKVFKSMKQVDSILKNPLKEGFNDKSIFPSKEYQILAGILLGVLAFGILSLKHK